MTFLKSLENIAKADDATLDGIPIEKRTKAFVQSFFGSTRPGHQSEGILGERDTPKGGFHHPMLKKGLTYPPINDEQYPTAAHYEFPEAPTEAATRSLYEDSVHECLPYHEFSPQVEDGTWHPEGAPSFDPWLYDSLATSRQTISLAYTSLPNRNDPSISYEALPPYPHVIQNQQQQQFQLEQPYFSAVPSSGRRYPQGRLTTHQDIENIPGWTPPGYSPPSRKLSVNERHATTDAGYNSSYYQSPSLGYRGSRGISRFQRYRPSQVGGPYPPPQYSGYGRERTPSFSTKSMRP
jgi:hypothetical protein